MASLTAPRAFVVLSMLAVATALRAARRSESVGELGWTGCANTGSDTWKPKNDLRFIHIPRTMGTTLEGCDRSMPEAGAGPGGNMSRWSPQAKAVNGKNSFAPLIHMLANPRKGKKCFIQHLPPSLLQSVEPLQEVYPYGKESNFCVVRHPYDRLISQFGFANNQFRAKWGFNYTCNAADLSSYLIERLNLYKTGRFEMEDCHWIPQSYFVYGYNWKNGDVSMDEKWCENVLHYENVGPEFNALMDKAGYGLHIGQGPKSGYSFGSTGGCAKLKGDDISAEAKALIHDVYKRDFELLGYKAK